MATTETRFNQSLAKGFGILEAFANQPGPLSLNELADLSGLDRSSTQRMLHTLVALGYLERGNNQRGYVLGKKILDRTFDFLRSHPLLERATPILEQLQQECGERVDLSLFDDLTIVYALRRQTKRQTFYATLVGRRMPTFSSSGGRAIMSHLTDAEIDDILGRSDLQPLTPKTITDPERIRQRVREARLQGYALCQEESMVGEIVLASAVVDHGGRPLAAIHISGLLAEWTPESFSQRFSSLAISAARALSGRSNRN
ncbi:IclR family transcriptional regulator [Achromobacter denitrificans]|nr:IclR family transcriptional regulator [Achromobacter denitrificans]